MSPATDERTLKELAKEALEVQCACNLRGVLFGWHHASCRLMRLHPHWSEEDLRAHPITLLWGYKIYDMLHGIFVHNMDAALHRCEELASEAKGESDEAS
jgi:hypothetical protein